MSVHLIYGPQGSGKTAWAEDQVSEHVQLVNFKDAYIPCRSTAFDWKPNPEFFSSINPFKIHTLIIDEAPILHTIRWADVYHATLRRPALNRIYLSQKKSNLLPLSVKVSPFSESLTA